MNTCDLQAPRLHHYMFVHRFLRDRVLNGPPEFFQKLQWDDSHYYLGTHWSLVGLKTGEPYVDSDGLEIMPAARWHEWSIIIIQLPTPERATEAYLAGIGWCEDSDLRRYFTLELSEDHRDIPGGFLCEWNQDEHINYETLLPADNDLFFEAIVGLCASSNRIF